MNQFFLLGSNGKEYKVVLVTDSATGKPLQPMSIFLVPKEEIDKNGQFHSRHLISLADVPDLAPTIDKVMKQGDQAIRENFLFATLDREDLSRFW